MISEQIQGKTDYNWGEFATPESSQKWKRIAFRREWLLGVTIKYMGEDDEELQVVDWRKPGIGNYLLPIESQSFGSKQIFSASTRKCHCKDIPS